MQINKDKVQYMHTWYSVELGLVDPAGQKYPASQTPVHIDRPGWEQKVPAE